MAMPRAPASELLGKLGLDLVGGPSQRAHRPRGANPAVLAVEGSSAGLYPVKRRVLPSTRTGVNRVRLAPCPVTASASTASGRGTSAIKMKRSPGHARSGKRDASPTLCMLGFFG